MERTLRLAISELEEALRKADFIDNEETVSKVHIEPGELVIIVE